MFGVLLMFTWLRVFVLGLDVRFLFCGFAIFVCFGFVIA